VLWAKGGARGRARLCGGVLLCLLGAWVDAAIGVLLGPLAVARAAADLVDGVPGRRGRSPLARELGLIALGLSVGAASVGLYPVLSGRTAPVLLGAWPIGQWPRALGVLVGRGLAGAGRSWLPALSSAVVLGLFLPWPPREEGGRTSPRRAALVRALGLLLVALLYALFTAALRWIAENQFHWRYLIPSLLLVHLAGAGLVAEPLCRGRALRPALALALVLVPLAALAVYGWPSVARVAAELDERMGAHTEEVLAARCDLVVGDYWSVWPAVWHAAWVAHRRGLEGPFGLTHRAVATVPLWKSRPRSELRICRLREGGPVADVSLRAFGMWPVRTLEERRTVVVVAPGARAGEATAGTSPPASG